MAEVTIENFKEVLEQDLPLKNTILAAYKTDARKLLEEDDKLIIRTPEEDEQYLQGNINARVEDEVTKRFKPKFDAEFGAKMNELDKRIFEITNIPKQPNEKGTDYYARALRESKDGDPITKAQNDELKALLHKERTEKETAINEIESKYERRQVEQQIDNALSNKQFPIPPHIKTDEDKQKYIDNQRRLLRNDFLSSITHKKDAEGNILFFKNNQPQIAQKDGRSKTAAEVIDAEYNQFFLQETRKVTGTGTGSNGKTQEPASTDFKSKEDIHKYLGASGIEAGTGTYMKQFEKLATEAGIEI